MLPRRWLSQSLCLLLIVLPNVTTHELAQLALLCGNPAPPHAASKNKCIHKMRFNLWCAKTFLEALLVAENSRWMNWIQDVHLLTCLQHVAGIARALDLHCYHGSESANRNKPVQGRVRF